MKIKSVLASVAACAIAVSAMAVTASAKVLNPKEGDDKYCMDITVPEGFVVSEEGLGASSSSLRTDFTFDSETDDDLRLYIAPVNRTVDEMISQVYGSFTSMTAERGSITEVKDAGNGSRYFAYHYAYDDEMEETHYIQSLVFYTPAAQNGRCVLISANVYPKTEEGYHDEADLLAIVQKVAAENLTMVKP